MSDHVEVCENGDAYESQVNAKVGNQNSNVVLTFLSSLEHSLVLVERETDFLERSHYDVSLPIKKKALQYPISCHPQDEQSGTRGCSYHDNHQLAHQKQGGNGGI